MVSDLALYDLAPFTLGVAADLSHIETPAKVTGYMGQDKLNDAVKDADVSRVTEALMGSFQYQKGYNDNLVIETVC